jgi:uncharacterized protein YutE (UPF0331/DUF86 family)
MTSADRIKEHVKHLQFRVERLRALQSTTLAEYAADFDRRDLIEHNFRIAIESCSDIALLLVARLGLPEPAHRRDVFGELADSGRLPHELATKLAELTSLRNLLVHRYLTVEPVRLLQHLREDLKYFEQFAATAIGWADELEKPPSLSAQATE